MCVCMYVHTYLLVYAYMEDIQAHKHMHSMYSRYGTVRFSTVCTVCTDRKVCTVCTVSTICVVRYVQYIHIVWYVQYVCMYVCMYVCTTDSTHYTKHVDKYYQLPLLTKTVTFRKRCVVQRNNTCGKPVQLKTNLAWGYQSI